MQVEEWPGSDEQVHQDGSGVERVEQEIVDI